MEYWKNKEYKNSKKQIRKYKYKFWKVIGTIIFFPITLIVSIILSKFFTPYLFKYPRVGLDKEGLEVNTVNNYLRDIKLKKLKSIQLKPNQVKEFEKEQRINKLVV